MRLCRQTIPFVLIILSTAFFFACASQRSDPASPPSPGPVVSTTPPFQTKEPVSYHAVRSMTFAPVTGGETVVTSINISRDGERRREEETSGDRRVVYLDIPEGRFLVLPDEKIYASIVNGPAREPQSPAEPLAEMYVHTPPPLSTYENLGTEVVNGKTTSKYRVVVNNRAGDSVTSSETLIWIDESVGMPVKSVTRSATGTQTMELSNVTLTVDTKQFELPQDYQKVELRALQQRIR